MADLKQLQEAMASTIKNMAEGILKKDQDIKKKQQEIEAETAEFDRLFASFLSLTGQSEKSAKNLEALSRLDVNKSIEQTQQHTQTILKNQQVAMQQANPSVVKMPQKR